MFDIINNIIKILYLQKRLAAANLSHFCNPIYFVMKTLVGQIKNTQTKQIGVH